MEKNIVFTILIILIIVIAVLLFLFRKKKLYFEHLTLDQSNKYPNRITTNDWLNNAYFINLERRQDRNEYALQQIRDKLGLKSIQRKLAVDGQSKELEDELTQSKSKMGKNHFACFRSHENLWRDLLNSDKESMFIFEDDVYIPEDVTLNDIQEAMKMAYDFDVVYVGFCGYTSFSNKNINFTLVPASKDNDTLACLHAYILNKKAASLLLENIRYEEPVDLYMARVLKLAMSNVKTAYVYKSSTSHYSSNQSNALFGAGMILQNRQACSSDIN